MSKVIKFWEKNVNAITGWKRPKKLKVSELEEPKIRKGFQDSVWKCEGFR